ncbi:MAG: hypothetical protein AAFY41_09050, partial [Bacteroidota bacterium]
KFNEKTILSVSSYVSNDEYDLGFDTIFNYSTKAISLEVNRELSQSIYGSVKAFHSSYKSMLTDRTPNQGFIYENGIDASGLSLDFDYETDEASQWNFGTSVKISNYDNGSRKPNSNQSPIDTENFGILKGIESSAYVENNRKIGEKLSVSVGLRGSVFGIFQEDLFVLDPNAPKADREVIDTLSNNTYDFQYSNLEPRITANWTLNKTTSTKVNFTRSVQYEHLFSSSPASLPTDLWRPSTASVLPGIANQFSIGFFKNLNDNFWNLSIESFYKGFENVNIARTGAEILENRLVDAEVVSAKGSSQGLELMIRKNKGSITGWLSYYYSQTVFQTNSDFREDNINNGDAFAADFDTPHNLNISVNYQLSRLWSVASSFIYKTGRPVTIPVASYTLSGLRVYDVSKRNNLRIPDTHRLDLSATLEGSNKVNKRWRSSFTFSLYNLYGRKNPFSFVTLTENGIIPKAYKISVFGNVIPSFTYNFNFK